MDIHGIKDIVKLLPFSEEFKLSFLQRVDSFSDDERFEAERILWEAYACYLDIQDQKNLEIFMDSVAKGEESLTGDVPEKLERMTEKDSQKEFMKDSDKVDLSLARQKLENLMKEKN